MATILEQNPITPVIVIDDANKAAPLAEALLAGGLNIIEITLRTEAAIDAVKAIRKEFPEMNVGVGTVITKDQAKQVIDAGSQFALSPGIDESIINIFSNAGLPFVPGIMTPSDILEAIRLKRSI